jgi:tetratricopeptide (TPR) repeat protein
MPCPLSLRGRSPLRHGLVLAAGARTLLPLACATALFTALVTASSLAPAADPPAKPAANAPTPAPIDPALVVRPEVGKAINAARDLISKESFKDGLAALQPALTTPDLSPYEHFLVLRLQSVALLGSGDLAAADPLQEQVVANPRLGAEDRLSIDRLMAQRWYSKAPLTNSVKWGKRYFADGGHDDVVHTIIIQSLYQAGDCQGVIEAVNVANATTDAAGTAPTESRLQVLSACAQKVGDEAGHVAALERLVQLYPKPVYWNNLLANLERKPGFEDYVVLEVYRLRVATGAITDPEDFLDMAKMAQRAGYPAEARRALDAGVAVGAFGKGKDPSEYNALRPRIDAQAEEDRRVLGQGDTRAESAKDGNPLFSAGLNYVTHEKYDPGIAMMERGLARGGLKRPALARLQLGEAYVRAGRKAEALKALAEVQGTDGTADVARLWSFYLSRDGK